MSGHEPEGIVLACGRVEVLDGAMPAPRKPVKRSKGRQAKLHAGSAEASPAVCANIRFYLRGVDAAQECATGSAASAESAGAEMRMLFRCALRTCMHSVSRLPSQEHTARWPPALRL
jgi:hypothetical protein